MAKYEFDENKLIRVPIDSIEANDWNPKNKEDPNYKKVLRSIELNGLTQPILVREKGKGFEVIDGEHRYRAAKELGYTDIFVYNAGQVPDKDAKALTVWHQVQVPFEEIDLSHLVVELDNLKIELPYSEKEILDFRNMAEFEFDYDGGEPDDMPDDDQLVPFSIKMTPGQLETFKRAHNIIKEDNDCSDGRALELLAIDFLSGYSEEAAN